jgi:hypothetical protein
MKLFNWGKQKKADKVAAAPKKVELTPQEKARLKARAEQARTERQKKAEQGRIEKKNKDKRRKREKLAKQSRKKNRSKK